MLHATANPTRVFDLLDVRGVSGKQLHVTHGGSGSATSATTLVLSREKLHDEDRLRRELTGAFGDEAVLVDGLGAVSVVGAGITANYVNVRRGTSCLKDHGIEPQGLATSSFRITWLVPRASLSDAVRELHTAFIVE